MSEADQSGAGRREVAYRLFAAEYDDADFSYSASDEERSPNYVITPTGARANRLFVVGVLTEIEPVNDDMLRARVVDPTGAFVVYAGQYQPDEMAALEQLDPPAFVAVTGKARTFQPDDADQVYTSIRPERISEVDAETRDRWTVRTAERTLDRVRWMATALVGDARGESLQEELVEQGADEGLAEGISLAIDEYEPTGAYLEAVGEMALDAARLVADRVEEVEPVSIRPDEGEHGDLAALTDLHPASGDTMTARESVDTATAKPESTTSNEQPATQSAETQAGTQTGQETEGRNQQTDTGERADADESATNTAETASHDTSAVSSSEGSSGPAESAESASNDAPEDTQTGSAEPLDDVGEFEPEEFEFDEEERAEIESEYGTEFQTGTEVDEPGEADIETPDPAEIDDADDSPRTEGPQAADNRDATGEPTDATADPVEPTESAAASAPDAGESESASAEAASSGTEEVDLEDAVVDVMERLDDGSGADREAVIDSVTEQYAADAAAVEDAIQDALMGGRCYEPADDTLKSI